MNNYSELLPKMLFGEDLKNTLQILPDYDESVRNLDAGTRLMELMNIYKVFVPQNLSLEIYTKLYMMTVMSLQQKGTVDATRQLNANHRAMTSNKEYRGIITGASSCTVIGPSGCGKTTLLNSIMALKRKNSKTDGFINFCGEEITKLSEKKLRELRGNEIAMIPQNAFLSMDPTKTIASMFFETVKVHNANAKKMECFEKAVELMSRLLLNEPERILKSYPFELSGGMCQRVAIAASMINSPKLLLGDEPTSALDVTSQEEVVNQLKYLKNNFKVSAVIISHNIGVISMISDDMAVMYGGKILEYGKTENVI